MLTIVDISKTKQYLYVVASSGLINLFETNLFTIFWDKKSYIKYYTIFKNIKVQEIFSVPLLYY